MNYFTTPLQVISDMVIREAEIEELGIKTGGKLVYNLRYAYDIALCAECQYLGRKTNREGGQHMKSMTTETKCQKHQTSESWEDTVRCKSYSGW